jgi:hypothetical protein
VLLGQARPQEAIEVLEEAVKLTPKHPNYDEIRWDLATAYLCAAHNQPEQIASATDWRGKAASLFKDIRDHEQVRETQPFSNDRLMLDAARSRSVCQRDPNYSVEAEPDPAGPRYILINNDYGPYLTCDWLGLVTDVKDIQGNAVDDLQVHVWGGGIDRRMWVGDNPRDDMVLASHPRETRDYYFAQLEDSDRKPVSDVYPIPTYDDCEKNLMTLTFQP